MKRPFKYDTFIQTNLNIQFQNLYMMYEIYFMK